MRVFIGCTLIFNQNPKKKKYPTFFSLNPKYKSSQIFRLTHTVEGYVKQPKYL